MNSDELARELEARGWMRDNGFSSRLLRHDRGSVILTEYSLDIEVEPEGHDVPWIRWSGPMPATPSDLDAILLACGVASPGRRKADLAAELAVARAEGWHECVDAWRDWEGDAPKWADARYPRPAPKEDRRKADNPQNIPCKICGCKPDVDPLFNTYSCPGCVHLVVKWSESLYGRLMGRRRIDWEKEARDE